MTTDAPLALAESNANLSSNNDLSGGNRDAEEGGKGDGEASSEFSRESTGGGEMEHVDTELHNDVVAIHCGGVMLSK